LLGGAGTRQTAGDALAARVLTRGENVAAPAGRADDFAWPRRNVAPVGADPVVATTTMPTTPMQERKAAAAPAAAPSAPAAAPPARGPGASRQAAAGPRPPREVRAQPPAEQRRTFQLPQRFFFPFFGR
jgi:hypothetical protein